MSHTGYAAIHFDAPGFATVAETAAYLRISRAMVHKLINQGVIPTHRFGRCLRISWAWLRDQTRSANEKI